LTLRGRDVNNICDFPESPLKIYLKRLKNDKITIIGLPRYPAYHRGVIDDGTTALSCIFCEYYAAIKLKSYLTHNQDEPNDMNNPPLVNHN